MAAIRITFIALVAALAFPAAAQAAPTPDQPTREQLAAAGLDRFPLAPDSARVDLTAPVFSDPTRITNPLFPISALPSAVLAGRVDGKRFHTETTLLPWTRIIEWPRGQRVQTRISQYVAFLDGRIQEVALDHYAQADDGSVWYFGEDVFNYERGVIADTEGSWIAGQEGPAAMIMPAQPRVGAVYRSENIPGLVFEQVTVARTGVTVDGPHGPVAGAIVGRELHDDGSTEDKQFAPGYGEFFTAEGRDIEAMALAVPADALPGPPPAALVRLSRVAGDAFREVRGRRWRAAASSVARLRSAWTAEQAAETPPPRLAPEMRRALRAQAAAVAAHDRTRGATAALDVARSALDLGLRHRPATEIDRARFELWALQVLVDVSARDRAAVAGDVATLEWVRDRFAHTLDPVVRTRVDRRLLDLRAAVTDRDMGAARRASLRLRAAHPDV
jgi:hypothetical protein